MADETRPTHTFERFSSNIDEAARFLSYIGAPFYTHRHLEWKLTRNPFGPGAAYLRHRDGAAAAHTSITPKPANEALLGDTRLGELGDTHTHPNFQRQGHFSAIGKHVIGDFEARADGKEALIYGLPNEQALPGWTRSIGCQLLNRLEITEQTRYPWHALYPEPLLSVLRERVTPGPQRLRADVDDPRAAIDAVWADARGSAWLVRKDSRWWEWRYRGGPDAYQTHVLEDASGSPRAWIVSRVLKTRAPGVRRIAIADVVGRSPADEANAFRQFMAKVPRLRDVVYGWSQPADPLAPLLAPLGFRLTRRVPVIFADNPAYHAVKNGPGWFRLSLGDTDNI